MDTKQSNPQTDPKDQEAQTTTPENNQDTGEQKLSKAELNFRKLEAKLTATEAKLAEKEAREAEAVKKKLESEGKLQELLDQERKEKAEIQAKYQANERLNTLQKELKKAGINEDLIDFVAPSLKVEFDDNNTPKNLSEVLESLKVEKPSLFISTTTSGNTSTGTTHTKDNGQVSIQEALRLAQSGDLDAFDKLNLQL